MAEVAQTTAPENMPPIADAAVGAMTPEIALATAAAMPRLPVHDYTQALRHGQPAVFEAVSLVACRIHGREFRFAVSDIPDPIQRSHRNGRFYEAEELEIIRGVFPLGGTFVDIGANVGNHSIFVGAFLSPAKIIPFEPNPLAWKLLLANLALNGLTGIADLSHVGVGLGASDATGFGMSEQFRNLGGARMLEGQGAIDLRTGDSLLARERPALIKIDVEGMELQVLEGLEATVHRSRPLLFVEVNDSNLAGFQGWCQRMEYKTVTTFRRYRTNCNYLIRPRRKRARAAEEAAK